MELKAATYFHTAANSNKKNLLMAISLSPMPTHTILNGIKWIC